MKALTYIEHDKFALIDKQKEMEIRRMRSFE